MNKNKSLYLKDNNKRLSNEINNDYLIRDTIVYDILNEHQYDFAYRPPYILEFEYQNQSFIY